MSPAVTVIDYGLGNLYSVARALEKVGATVTIAEHPEQLLRAERLILPGVGSFAVGMNGLHERGFVEPLRELPEPRPDGSPGS